MSDKLAYIGRKANIELIDISNPREPKIVGSTDIFGYVADVHAADGYVYLAGVYHLDIF